MQEKKEIHSISEKSAICQEGKDLGCEVEDRNNETPFSQNQRAYKKGVV